MTLSKGIVAGLILANVGYFLWVRGFSGAAAAANAGTPASLQLAMEAQGVATPGVATPGVATPEVVAPHAAEAVSGADDGLLKNVKRCMSIGPFRDVSEAARAAGTLRSSGYDPRQRVADGDVNVGVWVYLPLPPSRAAVDQSFAKLKAGGIEDAIEMPGPKDALVISLGLFGDAKRARQRIAQAQAMGYAPTVADRKRKGNSYWIDVDLKATDGLLSPSDLKVDNVRRDAGRSMPLEVKSCPAGASA